MWGVTGATTITGCAGPGDVLTRAVGAARYRGALFGGALGAKVVPRCPTSGREAGFGRTASISPLVPRRSSGSGPAPGGSAWPEPVEISAHSSKTAIAPTMSDCRIGRLRWKSVRLPSSSMSSEATTGRSAAERGTYDTNQFGAGEGIRTPDPNLGKVVPLVCTRLLGFESDRIK